MLAVPFLGQRPLIGADEPPIVAGEQGGIGFDACQLYEIILALDIPNRAVAQGDHIELMVVDARNVLNRKTLPLEFCGYRSLEDEPGTNLETFAPVEAQRTPVVEEAAQ